MATERQSRRVPVVPVFLLDLPSKSEPSQVESRVAITGPALYGGGSLCPSSDRLPNHFSRQRADCGEWDVGPQLASRDRVELVAVGSRVVRTNCSCGATVCHHGNFGKLGLVEADVLSKRIFWDGRAHPNLLELARVAFEQKDHTGALSYLAHARDLEPNSAAVHFLWGMICVEQNLAEEAYQALKKAVALDPNNAYYNYAAGAVAVQREDASESIPYFQKYCELKPRDPRGRLALGAAYFNSYEMEKAEKALATVVSDPRTSAGAHYYLARIANRRGDYAEAIRQLQMALKAYPEFGDAYAELGLVYLKRKEYPQAEEALQKAVTISPYSYQANLNLMILYQRTGSPKAADQTKRFEQIKEKRALRAKEFLRAIQVEP